MIFKFLGVFLLGVVVAYASISVNNQFKSDSSRENLRNVSPKPTLPPTYTPYPILTPKGVIPNPTPKVTDFKTPESNNNTSTIAPAQNDIRVEITEQELTRQLQSSLSGISLGSTPFGDATISDITARIKSSGIELTGTSKTGFLTLNFATLAKLEIKDSKPNISLSDLSLNGLSLPQYITDSLESTIQSQVNNLINSYGLRVKSITLEQGKIILHGV